MKEVYCIPIRCKKYVQRYLMRNFGHPVKGHPYLVDVRSDDDLREFLNRAIKNPENNRNKWLQSFEGKKRDCIIELLISADTFNRYGWELSITDEVHLNSILEARCKKLLLDFLKLQYALHEDLHDAIEEFYREFGFSERTWPSGSIAKIWTRSRSKLDIFSFKHEFNQLFTKIFMDKLSTEKDNLQGSKSSCLSSQLIPTM